MSGELDILAIEPFFGGARKAMLETIIRHSGHRWTLLKLPPRRIERRLVAAAHWFAEHLNLHWVANVDVIFVSDALNLAEFLRLIPNFAGKPTIVYFHTNQLPPRGMHTQIDPPAAPAILANLSSAAAAHELWFNSAFHQRAFLDRAQALLTRQTEDYTRNPAADLIEKSSHMAPPTDLNLPRAVQSASSVQRDKRTIFVDTRGANMLLLNETLETLHEREEDFQLITVGPLAGLSDQWTRATVPESNDFAIIQGLLKSGLYISARNDVFWDDRLLMALSAGCWPIVPTSGVYTELIPKALEDRCLYDGTSDHLAFEIQDFWELQPPEGYQAAIDGILEPVNAIGAVAAIDQRLMELAIRVG